MSVASWHCLLAGERRQIGPRSAGEAMRQTARRRRNQARRVRRKRAPTAASRKSFV